MALAVTDSNFENVVLKSDKIIMLDFWAEWCGPCRMVAPFVEQMAEEFKDKATIGKVDVDSNPGIAGRFGIRNIPTILFIKNGEVVDKQVGAVSKQALVAKLQSLL